MFGIFNRKKNSIPKIDSLDDLQKAMRDLGAAKAGEIIRKEAFDGNLLCQVFLSQGALQYGDQENAEIFTKLAAENGDVNSQANLALIYIKKVDSNADWFSEFDISMIKNAKHWHGKAAAQGFQPSITALKELSDAYPDI